MHAAARRKGLRNRLRLSIMGAILGYNVVGAVSTTIPNEERGCASGTGAQRVASLGVLGTMRFRAKERTSMSDRVTSKRVSRRRLLVGGSTILVLSAIAT